MRLLGCFVLATAAGACAAALAEPLGTLGPVYPIAEPHLLDDIKARLAARQRSGELDRLREQARQRAAASVNDPLPVAGLRTATVPRTFYFDPGIVLDRNIVDDRGAVLFAAGTRHNPLGVVSLSKHLLFFDGRDPRQVAKARQLIASYRGRVKAILVGGSYVGLMKAWDMPVFYDQAGTLVRKLGISAVPAIVSQEGLRLRIDEVGLP